VWFASIDNSISLDPPHWMYVPEDPPELEE
jgi:hypothetical protein